MGFTFINKPAATTIKPKGATSPIPVLKGIVKTKGHQNKIVSLKMIMPVKKSKFSGMDGSGTDYSSNGYIYAGLALLVIGGVLIAKQ